jgi:hypothetical protein
MNTTFSTKQRLSQGQSRMVGIWHCADRLSGNVGVTSD